MSDTHPRAFTLRDLSLPTRLTLAVFLITVGLGYFAALLNLRAQEGRPGELMPSADDVVTIYHRNPSGDSQLVRLLEAHPSLPFNGQGSMRSAFTKERVGGWEAARRRKAEEMKLDLEKPEERARVELAVHMDLEGERQALVSWARAGLPKPAYDGNRYALPANLGLIPITDRFVETEGGVRYAKVKSILEVRCARCHDERVGGPGSEYPLTTYREVAHYGSPEGPTGKSLAKLAMSTHVHLLGTTILFALSGFIVSFTGYPALLRAVICPLPLLAFLADIACQWLARLDPPAGEQFARAIIVTGGLVGAGLGAQVVLGLFALFGAAGRAVLVLLILVAGAGGYFAKEAYFDPMVKKEREDAENNHPSKLLNGGGPSTPSKRDSTLVRLLEAPADEEFNINGSMRSAFTTRLSGRARWERIAAQLLKVERNEKNAPRIEKKVQEMTEGERLALVAWARGGLNQEAFEEDRFELTGDLAKRAREKQITPEFVEEADGKVYARVKSIFEVRCTRCHRPAGEKFGQYIPLQTYEQIADYYRRRD